MGAELAAAVLGFVLIGIWIDRHYGTHPWGVLICAVSGLIGGLYNFFRSSLKAIDASNRRAGGTEDDGKDEGRR